MPNVRAHVIISGRVQGVFFRAHTRDIARQFNVYGWVKNRPDGKVEALFEGNEENVKSVLDWCHEGPPQASVTGVAVAWKGYSGEFTGFDIVYDGS